MGQFAWHEQVAPLGAMLDSLEAQAASGELATTGLEEFKGAMDDLRLRVWSLLTAASADDPHAFQARFRTRRGTEMCRALSTDLRTGKLSSLQPELPTLGTAARDLAAAVKDVRRRPSKARGKGGT